MNAQVTRSADGHTFELFIAGKQHRYANDKEGKRQAILDGLSAIATVAIEQEVYLPSNAALQLVAAVLYPDGIRTEAAYVTACEVAEKACAHLGYGDEVQLGPPHVPFTARGAYRKRYPPVESQLVLEELARAGMSNIEPRQEAPCALLWNKAGLAVYRRAWSQLTPTQQSLIQVQVDEIVAQAGWEKHANPSPGAYMKPLPIDAAAVRSRLMEWLRQEKGRPVSVGSVIYQVQIGAYGRRFYASELSPALQAIISEVLQANGYHPTPEEDEYLPTPIPLSAAIEVDIGAKLTTIAPVMTSLGSCLMLRDCLAVVQATTQVETINEWQIEQLVQEGALGRALRQMGYKTELTWCQAYQFQPRLGDERAHQVILKEVRVQNDPDRKLSLAKGLAVYTPAITIDDMHDTLVYLEMIGARQSVKANWAALVGGEKVHWIGRKRLRLEGMKNHVKIQSTLPCGWTDHILIHKQASLQEMNPGQPFYLLDDGVHPIPPLFYAMLNKSLALPMLEGWASYLWQNGREYNLIALLDNGEGQGYAAWRVMPASEAWQEITESGLKRQQITF